MQTETQLMGNDFHDLPYRSYDDALGELCVKFRNEISFHGFDISVLKSGIQKYARRTDVEKGLWCLIELDLFSRLERNGPALDAYLRLHPEETREKVQRRAKTIRSNMINRLVAMMSEEVNISAWWIPLKIVELFQQWQANRHLPSSGKFLVDMYLYLIFPKKIRLISDLKSVFLLPPYYLDDDKIADLKRIHNRVRAKFPELYANQDKVGQVSWGIESGLHPADIDVCINGIIYNLEKCSDNVFFWISMLCDLERKQGVTKYRYLSIVWGLLHRFIGRNSGNEFIRDTISALQYFYKNMKHNERPIYLYHAVLLLVRRDEIDWGTEAPLIDTPISDAERLYKDHVSIGKIEIDDFVLDLHTKRGKRNQHSLEKFALEGAYIKHENREFLIKEYREIYVLLKKELDRYHRQGGQI